MANPMALTWHYLLICNTMQLFINDVAQIWWRCRLSDSGKVTAVQFAGIISTWIWHFCLLSSGMVSLFAPGNLVLTFQGVKWFSCLEVITMMDTAFWISYKGVQGNIPLQACFSIAEWMHIGNLQNRHHLKIMSFQFSKVILKYTN